MIRNISIVLLGVVIPSFLISQSGVISNLDSIVGYRLESDWTNYHNEINKVVTDKNALSRDDEIIGFISDESFSLQENNELVEAGYIWNYAGKMYAVSGNFDKAVPYYDKAINQLSKVNDTTYLHLIHYYNAQAIILGVNDPSKALESSTEALRLYKHKKEANPRILGKLHYAQGWAYRGLNEYDKAIESFSKSIELSKDEDGYVETFVCRTYLEMGLHSKALKSALRAHQKYETLYGEKNNEYVLLIGRAKSGMGLHDEAIKLIRESIELGKMEYSIHHSEYIKLYYFLAEAQNKAGSFDDALISINKTFELSIPGVSKFDQTLANIYSPFPNLWVLDGLILMGQIHLSKFDETRDSTTLFIALDCFDRSIENVHLKRAELETWKSKQEFNKYGFDAFEGAIETSYKLYKHTNDIRFLNRMVNYMEGSRSIVLKSYHAEVEMQERIIPQERRQQLASIKRELAEIEKAYYLAVDSNKIYEVESLNKVIIEKRKEWTNMVKPFSEYVFQNESRAYQNSVSIKDIQSSIGDSSIVLMFFNLPKELISVIIGKKTVSVNEIHSTEVLTNGITRLYQSISDWSFILESLSNATKVYEDNARILGDLLIQDVIPDDMKYNKLIIMPHDNLFSIPFEVLMLDEQMLLEQAIVQYALSCDQIISSVERIKNNDNFLGGFAPEYQNERNLLAKEKDVNLRGELIDLPGTRKTLSFLSDKFGGQMWLGKEATKEAFLKNAHRFKMLHLGMHGQVHNEVAHLSKLYFSNDEQSSLTIGEIQSMNLQAEMVALSACQTNVGILKEGEGPLSLAYAFLYAGSKSILSSLWSVPDDQSSQIMVSFYDHLSKGLEKSQSLRKAKLDYLNSAVGIERHPSFWAGFILIGHDQPISNEASNLTILIIGLIAFIVLFIRFIIGQQRRKNLEMM